MKKRIMVCVTDQKVCEELIVNTIRSFSEFELELFIIHGSRVGVVSTKESRDALEYLFDIASNYGASISVLKTDNILDTLINFALENKIDIIVMGETRLADVKNSIITKMKDSLKDKNIYIKILPTIEKE
ncbi:MAG: universal stress protein UspA [Filifactoraceae bacterium]